MVPVTHTAISLFGAPLGPGDSPLAAQSGGAANVTGFGTALAPLAATSGAAAPAPFGDLLVEAVSEVQSLQSQAKGAIEGLISGKGVDVHEAMIAAQKAGMGFELALSVRNKALSAYQQVMGMQF